MAKSKSQEERTESAERTEKLVLTFPARLVREPITCRLSREHNLMVNIMRASISPDEQGHMVLELVGSAEDLDTGMAYLDEIGVNVEPLVHEVHWLSERCTHCTACTSACPTGALYVRRETMEVDFDAEKCIGCGLCIPVCSYRAMEIMV